MNKIRNLAAFGIIIIAIVFSINGCAAILKGTNEKVTFNSQPARAKVYINGEYKGETPIQLNLKSRKSYTVEFKREGFASCTYQISSEIGASWIILDIICGLLPVAIDAVTGSWYYLEPDNLNCNMEKNSI